MKLTEFFVFMADQLFEWVYWSKTVFPFEDFPTISLWELLMSSTLVALALYFIPGLNKEDTENFVDNFRDEGVYYDNGDMSKYDYDDDDF